MMITMSPQSYHYMVIDPSSQMTRLSSQPISHSLTNLGLNGIAD